MDRLWTRNSQYRLEIQNDWTCRAFYRQVTSEQNMRQNEGKYNWFVTLVGGSSNLPIHGVLTDPLWIIYAACALSLHWSPDIPLSTRDVELFQHGAADCDLPFSTIEKDFLLCNRLGCKYGHSIPSLVSVLFACAALWLVGKNSEPKKWWEALVIEPNNDVGTQPVQ